MTETLSVPPRNYRAVVLWLAVLYGMVFLMVIIGGITRLTGSGLSMVEWHPLMGALPPLTHEAWLEVFAKYKATPQYEQVNHWMELKDFKSIFLWEYIHRLFGRLLGVVFFIPWVILIRRKHLTGRLARHTAVAFVMGGLQGVLGWYMVQSGLVEVPEVSHYRLAAHLGLALLVAQYLLWILLDLSPKGRGPSWNPRIRKGAWALVGLISLQTLYGAFMAGRRAGWLSSTFPDMNGSMIPTGWWALTPGWRNLVANDLTIHFVHRSLGWLTVAAALTFCAWARRHAETPRQRWAVHLLIGLPLLQFGLGAATVILGVPTSVAVTHQACGALLLSASVFAAHSFSERARSNPYEQAG